eukprot:6716028-Prorocentrum_lima.AAC.1
MPPAPPVASSAAGASRFGPVWASPAAPTALGGVLAMFPSTSPAGRAGRRECTLTSVTLPGFTSTA